MRRPPPSPIRISSSKRGSKSSRRPTAAFTELRNVWRFDEVFSSTVVMDFDKNTDLKLEPNELAEVGKTVLDSLADYDYYMNLTINGKTITVQKPDIINVDYKDGQLLMFFAVKPAETMPLKGKLTFGVYDPTLYTSIDFPTDNDLALVGDGFKSLQARGGAAGPGRGDFREQAVADRRLLQRSDRHQHVEALCHQAGGHMLNGTLH